MAFSQNQVRQLYVAKAKGTANDAATIGTIDVKADTAKSHMYFSYKGQGGLVRSDLIDIKNIISAKSTDADALKHPLKKYEVVLDSRINSGAPVAGQDYILRLAFRNFVGLSEEDQYFKYGVVHTYSGMTASEFYKVMAISLAKNFSREASQMLKFSLKYSSGSVEVTSTTNISSLSSTYTGIIIEEIPQEWVLGTFPQVPVNFTIQPTEVSVNGDLVIWGTVSKVASTAFLKDGKKMADLEYFCMGNRGDIYRNMGFPNVLKTSYLVDPELEYNTIDIHYAYQGSNESVQKSEKTITLLVPKIGASNSVSNKLTNDIISAINTAAGTTIPALATT